MDCRWITSIRTGAVAFLTTKYLAIDNFKHISLIGLGKCIHSYMDCFLTEFSNRFMNFHLFKYKDHASKFIKKYDSPYITWTVHDKIEDLFKYADVIVSGVTYKNSVFTENIDIYKKGVLIIPIQSRGFENCDTIFDKVMMINM